METIVVGSFPEVAWADDLRGILRNAGIAAEIEDHGPRAHQVVIPDIQEDQALPVLDEIGYLNCPVPAPSQSPELGAIRRRYVIHGWDRATGEVFSEAYNADSAGEAASIFVRQFPNAKITDTGVEIPERNI